MGYPLTPIECLEKEIAAFKTIERVKVEPLSGNTPEKLEEIRANMIQKLKDGIVVYEKALKTLKSTGNEFV